ncbi:translocation/assembly module TamB domain-containing protein [Methylocella sp.]|uniref:translocation/assembly module TamB domain-containing protein n=1 Tax=Methylocella sp. TaxID=1978226 RepID=UPI0037848821
MARRRLILIPAAALGVTLSVGAGFLLVSAAGRAADDQKSLLANLISRALSTPESRVSIGDIQGALTSDATVTDIRIADRDGVWLTVNRARIVWSWLALLQRRLDVTKLDVDHIDMPRRPIPAEAPVSGEEQPLLPELPVSVDIRQLTLARADLGQPVLGVKAAFSMGGSAKIGAPSEGLQAFLDAQSLDRPGTFNLRLNLVPDTQRLDLKINLDEPAGGLLSELANIPNRPPVRFTVDGSGVLDAFTAKLLFDAGAGVGAKGDAALTREGAGRRFGFDLAAEVSGLLPPVAAPVFAGVTRLSGNVNFNDDSSVAIPGVELRAAAARLVVKGDVSKDKQADVTVTAENIPNAGAATKLRDVEIGRLALDAALRGALDQPTIDSTLTAERMKLPTASLGRLDASFKAAPNGPIGATSTLLVSSVDASVKDLALANPALAKAVGSQATFVMRGKTNIRGVTDVERFELKAQSLTAGFKGRAAQSEINGRLDAAFPDLSRFAGLAGLDLAGAAVLNADVEGTPRSNRYSAVLDGRASRFATGLAAVDGLFGGDLTLKGGARLDADGGVGFNDLRLNGPHASARIDGAATPARADLTAQAFVPDLAKADPRASGVAEIDAHVTGTLDKPDADARVLIRDASLMRRPVPRLELNARARDLRGALSAEATLDGEIDRKPAKGAFSLTRPAEGGYALKDLDLLIGSATARGALTLDAANFASGGVKIHAPNLDDLSPLALQKLSGALDLDAAFLHQDGRQDATLKAAGQGISGFDVTLRRVSADLAATDLYRSPRVSGQALIDEAKVAGETISRVRLDARPQNGASDVTLSALARGFTLDARAAVAAQTPLRVDFSRLDVTRGRDRVSLAGPASVTIQDGGADIRNFALNLSGGRLFVNGRAARALDLKVEARKIPLSVANVFSPGLDLAGTLDGEANVSGPAAAPTGGYRLAVAGLAAPQTRDAGLPPIRVDAKGRFEGGRVTTDAAIDAGKAGRFRIAGSAPMGGAGALDLSLKGELDASVANRTMSSAGRSVAGRVAVDGRVGGTLEKPQAFGSATLSNGAFQDATHGVRLADIRARLVAAGDRVTIDSASARTPNGGTITASGGLRIDPAAGFPGDVRVKGSNAQLLQGPIVTAVANLDLALSGPLARAPRIGGRVDFTTANIQIPDRLPASLRPLPARQLNPTPTARAVLASLQRDRASGPAFNALLDLAINAPGGIRIRGRGLDATLGGGLRLTGSLSDPKPVGAFSLVSGNLRVLTTDLSFTRANLTFSGDLDPTLDFLANTQAGGASIYVAITGDPADPQFAFTSSPDLPQDEVISRLLFGQASGQLSPTQALMLAQAVAIYTGGNDALEGLRRSLGLGAQGSVDPLSKFFGDRVSVGVQTGATPKETGVGVNVNIWKAVKARGVIDATGAVRVGVGAEHEW